MIASGLYLGKSNFSVQGLCLESDSQLNEHAQHFRNY